MESILQNKKANQMFNIPCRCFENKGGINPLPPCFLSVSALPSLSLFDWCHAAVAFLNMPFLRVFWLKSITILLMALHAILRHCSATTSDSASHILKSCFRCCCSILSLIYIHLTVVEILMMFV